MILIGLVAHQEATNGHKQRYLDRIITADEKWCLYVNMKCLKEGISFNKHATRVSKLELHL